MARRRRRRRPGARGLISRVNEFKNNRCIICVASVAAAWPWPVCIQHPNAGTARQARHVLRGLTTTLNSSYLHIEAANIR